MLAANNEIGQSLRDWAGGRNDVDHVFHTVSARMADPLPAGHELPFRVVPECVAHTAMTACQSRTVCHRAGNVLHIFVRDRPHSPAGDDQLIFHQLIRIRKTILGIVNLRLISGFLYHPRKPCRGQLGLMSVPSTLKDQYLFHMLFSFSLGFLYPIFLS